MSLQHLAQPPPPYHPHSLSHDLSDLDDLKLPSVPAASFLAHSPPQLPTLEPLPSMTALTNALDAPHMSNVNYGYPHPRTDVKPLHLPRIQDIIPGDIPSPTDAASVASFDTIPRLRDTSVSMQDADDRMAAEALCGLGKVESNQSDPSHNSRTSLESIRQYRSSEDENSRHRSSNEEPEPFLQLLASSHPWLGGTINNSLSAYSSTKSHSPRILQYGADFVERNIGSPVVSTVGSVGRRTGIEGSVRRYLDARRSSELEHIDPDLLGQDPSLKRRRIEAEEDSAMDIDSHDSNTRRKISDQSSVDTLPAYDDNRSPEYQEDSIVETPRAAQRLLRPAANRSWSTQLMISTSGLGAALNEASLRSLKYCLHVLRTANKHVRNLMDMLKRLLSDYERAPNSPRRLENGTSNRLIALSNNAIRAEERSLSPSRQTTRPREPSNPQAGEDSPNAETIAKHIQHLNEEIWHTLKNVVKNVSHYTGGALPESAAGFVKSQLMSVPRRWQRAVTNSGSSDGSPPSQHQSNGAGSPSTGREASDAVDSANRMLLFAMEGIDMMEQVGGVVDSTIVSAEAWLNRMGRQPRGEVQQDGVPPLVAHTGDVSDRTSDATYDDLRMSQPYHPPAAAHLK